MKKILLTALFSIALTALFAQKIELKPDGKYYQSGKLYTGLYVENDDKGVKLAIHKLKDGIEDGTKMTYFPSGKAKEHQEYKAGKKTGVWMTWNEKGIKISECHYLDDVLNGSFLTWYDDGKAKSECTYEKGVKKGNCKEWDATGKLIGEKKN